MLMTQLTTTLSTMTATSPVTFVGGGLALAAAALFLATRAPEFLVVTLSACAYAVLAAIPYVQA